VTESTQAQFDQLTDVGVVLDDEHTCHVRPPSRLTSLHRRDAMDPADAALTGVPRGVASVSPSAPAGPT
ncbi:MAG: hypothetical protein ACRYF3_06635, partial [Janthinobacterium lividum]